MSFQQKFKCKKTILVQISEWYKLDSVNILEIDFRLILIT